MSNNATPHQVQERVVERRRTTVKEIIRTQVSRGNNSVTVTRLYSMLNEKFRLTVHVDGYESQSYGEAEAWGGVSIGWQSVWRVPGILLETDLKLAYVTSAPIAGSITRQKLTDAELVKAAETDLNTLLTAVVEVVA
jgi:hypothetical protein